MIKVKGREPPKRKVILLIAIVMSVILYLAGVFSGLYANKIIEKQTQSDMITFKNETARDIAGIKENTSLQIYNLKEYLSFLDTNLKTLQLEEIFIGTLDDDRRCKFSSISVNHMIEALQEYRDVLPFRIEEYERNNPLSDNYLELKKEYNELSLWTWMLSRNLQKRCNSTVVQGLYFYSTDCDECVMQGEELDIVTQNVTSQDRKIMLFTIDKNSDNVIVELILELYSINQTPAIIINDDVYQGRLFSSEELLEVI